jgi:hypothetical protein
MSVPESINMDWTPTYDEVDKDKVMTHPANQIRSKTWFLTFWPKHGDITVFENWEIVNQSLGSPGLTFYAQQREIGLMSEKEGREGLHCHMYFGAKKRITLKSIFQMMDVLGMEHPNAQNMDFNKNWTDKAKVAQYCVKEYTRVPGTTVTEGELGKLPMAEFIRTQGRAMTKSEKKRKESRPTKIDWNAELWKIIETLKIYEFQYDIVLKLAHQHDPSLHKLLCANKCKVKDNIEGAYAIQEQPDRINQGLTARIGCAKTGKSMGNQVQAIEESSGTAYEGAPMRMLMHEYGYKESFQNYCNQSSIHLGEFGGANIIPLFQFKQMFEIGKKGSLNYFEFPRKNKTPIACNITGGFLDSNLALTSFYAKKWEENPKEWAPFIRRFKQVLWFPYVRLNDNPSGPMDYLIGEDGCYVSNAYEETTNPNPSVYDITSNLLGTTYHRAQRYFQQLEKSADMAGRKPTGLNVLMREDDGISKNPWYDLIGLVPMSQFRRPKVYEQFQLDRDCVLAQDDPIIEVCVHRFKMYGYLPELEYCAVTQKFTVEMHDDDVARIRGGGPDIIKDITEDSEWGTGHGMDGATDSTQVCGVPNDASTIPWWY